MVNATLRWLVIIAHPIFDFFEGHALDEFFVTQFFQTHYSIVSCWQGSDRLPFGHFICLKGITPPYRGYSQSPPCATESDKDSVNSLIKP